MHIASFLNKEFNIPQPRFFPILLFLIITVIFCAPILKNFDALGRGDWDYMFFIHEVPHITAGFYHQFPFWNPYYCGGVSLIANPQARFLSPSSLYAWIFGVIIGLKIEIIIHLFLGMLGMYFLSKHLKIEGIASFLPSILFTLNGFFALHLAEGHILLLSAAYLPFIFLFYLKALKQPAYIFLSALFLSLVLLEGGIWVMPYFILFLAIYSFLHSMQNKTLMPIVLVIILFFIFILFSGPKLFPAFELLNRYPRLTKAGKVIPLRYLYDIFLKKGQSVYTPYFPDMKTGWWEYGAYLGLLPFLLFILSFRFFKERWPLFVTAILFLLIAIGNYGWCSPWSIIHSLPIFNSMHVPARSFFIFIFIFSILAGLYFNYLAKKRLKIFHINIPLIILCFIAIDLTAANSRILHEAFLPISSKSLSFNIKNGFKQIKITEKEKFKYGAWSSMYFTLMKNEGVINGYDPVPIKTNAIPYGNDNYKGEFFLREGRGEANLLYWSPNKLIFHCAIDSPDTLVINQNFDKGWRTDYLNPVKPFQGLISLDLKPMNKTIIIYYLPFSFIAGLCASIIGALFFIFRNRLLYPLINKFND